MRGVSSETVCPYQSSGFGCTISGNSGWCAVPPKVMPATFSVHPQLLIAGHTAQVAWSIVPGTQSLLCTVSGSNNDSWTNIDAGTHTTSPIRGTTFYSLECKGRITGDKLPAQKITVSVAPVFQEK